MTEHTNRLIDETSPYLLQHAHNPVDWYPWGEAAFGKARAEDRPILLSVGYSACHWCHVMAHESFEDQATAEYMNAHFVNIKVDREERPDVDAVYMQAVQALTQHGGWPLTAFLTPEGEPFYGGTYYPPEPRHGMPGFRQVLEAMSDVWRTRRDEAAGSAAELTRHLQQAARIAPGEGEPQPELLAEAATAIERRFEERHGGWGGAPKFPAPQTIEFLLRRSRDGDTVALAQAEATLDHMANGGIYDQLGGGFHRYSTDAEWLVPHFEKMLYDNAQLARAYLSAFQVTAKPRYRGIVEETLAYVLREMTSPEGGFYSAQDADSEGEEGKFFVWSRDEIRQALGRDAMAFEALYDVSERGNWEGVNVLRRVRSPEQVARVLGRPVEDIREAEGRGRATLWQLREQRVKPGLDDKVLANWNGLQLAALADAGRVLERAEWIAAARRNAEFVLGNMRKDGRLRHSYKQGQARVEGFASDYALYAYGLLALYRATWETRWVAAARELIDTLLAEFWDAEQGGFFQTGVRHEALVARPKELFDEAVPSANGIAASVLLRLAALTGEGEYERRARTTIALVSRAITQYPSGFGSWLNALDQLLASPREVAIAGDPGLPDTARLLRELDRRWLPNVTVAVAAPGDADAAQLVPLLRDRPQRDELATAYVCRDWVCNLPTTDAAEMLRQVEERGERG